MSAVASTGETATCPLCGGTRSVPVLRLEDFGVVRCTGCDLISLDTRKSTQHLRDLYGANYFEERREYFFANPVLDRSRDGVDANVEEFRDGLRALEGLIPAKGRLLDVGCGVGVFLTLAREQGWDVRGIDISPFASAYARDTLGLPADEGTLVEAAYPAGRFDAVTLWDCIEHVADPVAELREVWRILRPGGVLMLNTPNEAGLLKATAKLCYRTSGGVFRYPARKLYHEYHLYYFTPQTLTAVVEHAGFQLLELQRSLIPLSKARGTSLEKAVVRLLSGLERMLGLEYQLLAIARKP